MNQNSNHQPIDPDLETRIVTLVLGEASEGERDQLQRLIEQQPELATLKQHYEKVHGLLQEVGAGESPIEDDSWKLPAEKRDEVLSVISGKKAGGTNKASTNHPVALRPRMTWHTFKRVASIAAVFLLIASLGIGLMMPAVQSARESARVTSSIQFGNESYGGWKGGTSQTYNMPVLDEKGFERDHSESMWDFGGGDGRSIATATPESAMPAESKHREMQGQPAAKLKNRVAQEEAAPYGAPFTSKTESRFSGIAESNSDGAFVSGTLSASESKKGLKRSAVVITDGSQARMRPTISFGVENSGGGNESGQVPGKSKSDQGRFGGVDSDGIDHSGDGQKDSVWIDQVPMGGKLDEVEGRDPRIPDLLDRLQKENTAGEVDSNDNDRYEYLKRGRSSNGLGRDQAPAKAQQQPLSPQFPSNESLDFFDADSPNYFAYGEPDVRTKDLVIDGYLARTGRIMLGGAVNSDAGVTGQATGSVRSFRDVFGNIELSEAEQAKADLKDTRLENGLRRNLGEDRFDDQSSISGETGDAENDVDEALESNSERKFQSTINGRGVYDVDDLLGRTLQRSPSTGTRGIKIPPGEATRLDAPAFGGQIGGGQMSGQGEGRGGMGGGGGDMGGGGGDMGGDGLPQWLSDQLKEAEEHAQSNFDPLSLNQPNSVVSSMRQGTVLMGGIKRKPVEASGWEKLDEIPGSTTRGKASALSISKEIDANAEAFSTFSLHVSDVSFKLAQAALSRGQWPDAAKIRIEEFVNAFDYGDPMPCHNEKVACQVEQAVHPFLQQRNVLRVSMRTAAAGRASNTPLRLTLLLDSSGSMERIDRQQTVRRAFEALTSQLKAFDEVTLISFARTPRLLAENVTGKQAGKLVELIENLPSEGGTNLEAAIELAFEKAKERQADDAQSRIILLTDGAVNLGDAKPENLFELIQQIRNEGIAFDAAGISANGLNDEVLEAMTRSGDGRYYLLDSSEDADDGFAKQIAGALRPSAKNVKVQIEFNPRRVGRYRLLGFEKHLLDKEDFKNDTVDAAEMAAAESGVAMYQFEPKPDGEGDIGSVSVRFRDLSTGEMIENRWPIPYQPSAARCEQASPSLRIATSAALFAAALRGEPLGQSVDLKTLSELMSSLPESQSGSKRVQQLRRMIEQARQIGGR